MRNSSFVPFPSATVRLLRTPAHIPQDAPGKAWVVRDRKMVLITCATHARPQIGGKTGS